MGKLTITTFLTLDGVMQAPGGPKEDPSGGFRYGGWFFPFADEEFGKHITAIFKNADAFLLGRKTYEIFAGFWPEHDDANDPVASGLNKLPKHVASTTLTRTDWNNASLIQGDVVKAVRELKAKYPRELQVHGSAGLAQTLLANDLVDELHLFVCPVVLGRGKRLFGEGTVPAAVQLTASHTTPSGIAVLTYDRAGKPSFGSFSEEMA